jgi:hypothetical protein
MTQGAFYMSLAIGETFRRGRVPNIEPMRHDIARMRLDLQPFGSTRMACPVAMVLFHRRVLPE